jgi:eukaryotic-like serine/threonine-protein kinase
LFDSGGWLLYFLGSRRVKQGSPPQGKLPERIAGFTIRGALKVTQDEKILLGEDASVGRKVFIWLRPHSAPPLDRARREVGRRTRLRWVACGKHGDLQWDTILAPTGCPLPELIQSEGKLTWPELRPLLEALADELAAACADGTLPRSLGVDQVWVQPDGRAQLADTALTEGGPEQADPGQGSDQERALALLRQVAALALEGRAPGPAGRALDRLLGGQPRFETVQQFLADLTPKRAAPTR